MMTEQAPPGEKTIPVAGRTIAYDCPVDLARPQGEIILFVHGASFNRRVWKDQVAYFAKSHRPVALDLPGHGHSSAPIADTVPEFARVVKAFVDALGLKDFILVGHSMGGAIAQYYAIQHPDDLKAVVLVSTAPSFHMSEEMIAAWRQQPEKYRAEEIKIILAPVTPQAIADQLLAWRDANHPDAQFADLMACYRWDGVADFAKIRHPMLLITGQYDTLLETTHEMHKQIPSSQVVVLERSGHMMSVEEPAEVSAAIDNFIKGLKL